MFSMANQLRHGSGLVIAAAIMEREAGGDEVEAMEEAERERAAMDARMKEMAVNGFAMTVTCTDANDGKRNAIQCAGLGPLTPNTILMGWPWWWSANPKTYVPEFLTVMQQATMRHKAVLLYHNMKDFPLEADGAQEGYIDVWWIKHDGGLLLLISHLLQKHRLWKKCLLRLHLIIESGTDPQLVRERVHKLLTRINIKATVEEVILVDSSSLLPYMQVTGGHCPLHLLHRRHLTAPPPPSPLQSSDIRQEAEAHILQEVKHKSAAELAAEELMMHPTNVPDRRSDMDETRPHRGGSVDRNLDRLGGSVDGTPTTARRELVKELNASGVELTSGPPGVSLPQAAAEEEGRQGNGGRRASLRPLSEGTYEVVPAPAAAKAPSTAAAAPPKRPPTIEVAAAVKTEKSGDAVPAERVGDVLVESSASRKGSRVHFVTARPEGDEAAAPAAAPGGNGKAPAAAPLALAKSLIKASRSHDSYLGGKAPAATTPPKSPPLSPKSLPAASPPQSPRLPPSSPGLLSAEGSRGRNFGELENFIAANMLSPEAAEQLRALFERNTQEAKSNAVSYRWDEIHDIIVERSHGSSLVLINLPDPPEVHAGRNEENMPVFLEYMEYMEGLAANLPRVLYVHGTGQEVIRAEAMR